MLVSDQTRRCPICAEPHPLQLHGWYDRYGLFPHPEKDARIAVRRLRCVETGRTVSLLPDFCIPKRQHGPAILGPFLIAVILQVIALLVAIRRLRPRVDCHSVAQSLLGGFVRRDRQLRVYLSQRLSRIPEAPPSVPVRRRPMAELLLALQQGAGDVASAFIQHGRAFHRCFQLGLA